MKSFLKLFKLNFNTEVKAAVQNSCFILAENVM